MGIIVDDYSFGRIAATALFNIPTEQVVELGQQVKI